MSIMPMCTCHLNKHGCPVHEPFGGQRGKELREKQAKQKEEIKQVLEACKTKLNIYRENTNGEYMGGMEHRMLVNLIDETIEGI